MVTVAFRRNLTARTIRSHHARAEQAHTPGPRLRTSAWPRPDGLSRLCGGHRELFRSWPSVLFAAVRPAPRCNRGPDGRRLGAPLTSVEDGWAAGLIALGSGRLGRQG